MSADKALSDYVRDYIKELHQKDATYFETKSVNERNRDFKIFCEQNKKLGFDYGKHRSILTTQLSKLSKELVIDLTKVGIGQTKTEKFTVTKGGQKGNITLTSKKPTATTDGTKPTEGTASTTGEKKTEQIIVHPPLCQCLECKKKRGEYEPLDAETCGAPFEVMIELWHARNPKVKVMTEQEVNRIGKAWSPIFSKYLGADIIMFLAPIFVTGQIVLPRLSDARGDKKDKKKDERDYSDEPEEDSNIDEIKKNEKVSRKYFSSSKIDQLKKDGEID